MLRDLYLTKQDNWIGNRRKYFLLASTLICSARSFQLRLSKSRPPAYAHMSYNVSSLNKQIVHSIHYENVNESNQQKTCLYEKLQITLHNTYACIEHFIPESTIELLWIRFCKTSTKDLKGIYQKRVSSIFYTIITSTYIA